MSAANSAIAKQYARYEELDAAARLAWDKSGKALKRLVRLAKMGRKLQVIVPISENRGVQITDQYRTAIRNGSDKIFTKAYCRRHEVKAVPLDND